MSDQNRSGARVSRRSLALGAAWAAPAIAAAAAAPAFATSRCVACSTNTPSVAGMTISGTGEICEFYVIVTFQSADSGNTATVPGSTAMFVHPNDKKLVAYSLWNYDFGTSGAITVSGTKIASVSVVCTKPTWWTTTPAAATAPQAATAPTAQAPAPAARLAPASGPSAASGPSVAPAPSDSPSAAAPAVTPNP